MPESSEGRGQVLYPACLCARLSSSKPDVFIKASQAPRVMAGRRAWWGCGVGG